MKLFLFAFISFFSIIAFAEKLSFSRTFSIQDTVCCGRRLSEVYFTYTYIFDDNQNKSARAECSGIWNKSTLVLIISDSINFNIHKNRTYKAEFANENTCLWKLREINKAKKDLPFLFDSSDVISVFGEPTEIKWVQ